MDLRIVPYIVNGSENTSLSVCDLQICRESLQSMQQECKTDRLAENYTTWLKLDSMTMYCLALDNNCPVMFSGAQHISNNCCRLFSRYYLFKNYRTTPSISLYDKVDDFKTDMYMLNELQNHYKLFFWSRDRGTSFFKRIKEVRNDLFKNWTVHNSPIELLFENNYQGIMYTGDSNYINELTFNK